VESLGIFWCDDDKKKLIEGHFTLQKNLYGPGNKKKNEFRTTKSFFHYSLSLRVVGFVEPEHLRSSKTPWSVLQDGSKITFNSVSLKKEDTNLEKSYVDTFARISTAFKKSFLYCHPVSPLLPSPSVKKKKRKEEKRNDAQKKNKDCN